jgi:rubredoxin
MSFNLANGYKPKCLGLKGLESFPAAKVSGPFFVAAVFACGNCDNPIVFRPKNGKKQHKIIASTELQFEIECPRCFEIMALYSSFDSLYYFCEECNFHLYTNTKNEIVIR